MEKAIAHACDLMIRGSEQKRASHRRPVRNASNSPWVVLRSLHRGGTCPLQSEGLPLGAGVDFPPLSRRGLVPIGS
jgi:hypothetical protein